MDSYGPVTDGTHAVHVPQTRQSADTARVYRFHLLTYLTGDAVALLVKHLTCDLQVAGSSLC